MASRRVLTAGLAVVSILATHHAEARRYQLADDESRIVIHVGKAGILKRFGHEHVVAVRSFSGQLDLDEDALSRSRVSLIVDSRSLQVLSAGEPPKDIPKVQQTMLGPEVLDTQRYPRITLTSRRATATMVRPQLYNVQLTCDVELHGVVKPISFPLQVEITGDRVVARGTLKLRQKDFGIRPVKAAGGTIKVKNEVASTFTLVGHAAE